MRVKRGFRPIGSGLVDSFRVILWNLWDLKSRKWVRAARKKKFEVCCRRTTDMFVAPETEDKMHRKPSDSVSAVLGDS